MSGKASSVGGFSEYDEYVPMVDKAVDASWEKQVAYHSASIFGGKNVNVLCD